MTNKYLGCMIIDSRENCFFLNFSNPHIKCCSIRIPGSSRAFSWENEQHLYAWPVKLTFDKIQAVMDLGCLYSNVIHNWLLQKFDPLKMTEN